MEGIRMNHHVKSAVTTLTLVLGCCPLGCSSSDTSPGGKVSVADDLQLLRHRGHDSGAPDSGEDSGTGDSGSDSGTSDSGSDSSSDSGTTDSGTSAIKTVFIILMENHNWSQIQGSSSAPYINNTLLPQSSFATQYFNPPGIHPSEPNYIWLEAGNNNTGDITFTTDNDPSATNSTSTTQHIATLLKNAGISWKTYQENISGTVCPLSSSGEYAAKHNPFVFFQDSTGNNNPNDPYCIAHNRPYTELASDLTNNTVSSYNFITPNLCDDMHDSCAPTNDPIKQGDTWLSTEVPKILASAAYKNNGALFVTWDEAATGDGPIGMIVTSPLGKGGGYSNSIHYTHSSTVRSVEEIFRVQPLLRDAVNATDLSDLFATFP
jgi:phosphatidylinositol-3-phosphatase